MECYEKTIALFEFSHSPIEDIFVIININDLDKKKKLKPQLNYRSLLKAVCNQDLGLKPSMSHNSYFINIHRKTIFHVYDNRGCDLLAASSNSIKDIYRRYNDSFLD